MLIYSGIRIDSSEARKLTFLPICRLELFSLKEGIVLDHADASVFFILFHLLITSF